MILLDSKGRTSRSGHSYRFHSDSNLFCETPKSVTERIKPKSITVRDFMWTYDKAVLDSRRLFSDIRRTADRRRRASFLSPVFYTSSPSARILRVCVLVTRAFYS